MDYEPNLYKRYAVGMLLEHGFYQTEPAQLTFNTTLEHIRNATVLTLEFNVVEALLKAGREFNNIFPKGVRASKCGWLGDCSCVQCTFNGHTFGLQSEFDSWIIPTGVDESQYGLGLGLGLNLAERLRPTQRLLLTRCLIGEQHCNSALQLSLPLAVFIVSWAAPLRYRHLVAAALTIQRVWRGALARQRLRLRIARAHLSTRAMQRLASKLAGKEPAVVALEALRVVHKQLLSAMEQQEQVVSESMERSAVARERMRISQLGLASVRPNAERPFVETAQAPGRLE